MDYTELKAEDYKPVKCPVCKKGAFKGPRAMSMHMHLEHDNLSPKDMQKNIAIGTFGQMNVNQWVNILNKDRDPDAHKDIPSAVKKYWKFLRHEENVKAKKKKEIEAEISASKEGRTKTSTETEKGLSVLPVGKVKTKLRNANQESVIGIFIKDLNSWRFLKDALRRNPEALGDTKTQRDINLVLTKKVEIEGNEIDPKNKLLHVNEFLKFLDWEKISDDEVLYINTKGKGGAKLTKIEQVQNTFGSKSILFTFQYDKRYYKGLIRKYLQSYKKRK